MMKTNSNLLCWALGVFLGMLAVSSPALAQYPDRPVRILVPVPAGGGTDLLARTLAQRLSEIWGQPVVVENKGGGGGIICGEMVIRSAPDGYTLLLTDEGVITATPTLYRRPDFAPAKQLAPIAQLATVPYVAVVHPSVPAKTIPELIALMKDRQAKQQQSLSYGTATVGAGNHLAGEQFKVDAGVEMLIVPYKGQAPAVTDVVAGHLQLGFFSIPGVQAFVQTGALRALAVTSDKRSALFPELPTVSETLPGFDWATRFGMWAPLGTPADILEQIGNDVRGAMNDPALAAVLLAKGFAVATTSAAEYAELMEQVSARTARTISKAGLQLIDK